MPVSLSLALSWSPSLCSASNYNIMFLHAYNSVARQITSNPYVNATAFTDGSGSRTLDDREEEKRWRSCCVHTENSHAHCLRAEETARGAHAHVWIGALCQKFSKVRARVSFLSTFTAELTVESF